MRAIHDPFTHQMRNRLKTSVMGLGLVRLLQDARRFDEARRTLSLLENGFQDAAEKSDGPSPKPCKPNRLKRGTKTASCSSTRIDAPDTFTQPLSIA
jgi:hypothetical protein